MGRSLPGTLGGERRYNCAGSTRWEARRGYGVGLPLRNAVEDYTDDVQHSLLILGQPGSGTTTTLLTLARELIARAAGSPVQPLPVVFNLSSWAGPEQSLAAWLENELSAKYQIPGKIGRGWLEHNRLLLLLDGLDEVAEARRTSCVEAINRFIREIGLPGLAVCCRLDQYQELSVKLALNAAISLRPLTDAQIDGYVQDAGAALGGLRSALCDDPALRELARSPLMLNLMCLAYRDHGAQELRGGGSEGDRPRHLFATYIDRMFARRGKPELAYPRERTLAWLSWVARRLSERSRTMILMEDLQPGWLSTGAQRWAYLIGLSLVLGLLIGSANIAYWSTSALTPGEGGLNYGEIIGSISFSIETVESLGWSPAIAWRGALLELLGGLAVGAFAFLPTIEISHAQKLILLAGFGTVGLALGALLGGLEPRVFEGKTATNQGIRFSLRMAALMGLNALWLVAIVWAFAKLGGFEGAAGLQAILGFVAGMFMALFLWYGGIDVLKHYVLRAVLTASGQVPWNLGRLLDHARDLNLMQRVGNGYIFVHRRLLEHLAVVQLRA